MYKKSTDCETFLLSFKAIFLHCERVRTGIIYVYYITTNCEYKPTNIRLQLGPYTLIRHLNLKYNII